MYVVFRRYVDAEVMADLLRGVHGFVSYCLRLRRRELAADTVCDSQAGTPERNEAAALIGVPEIIIGDPIHQF